MPAHPQGNFTTSCNRRPVCCRQANLEPARALWMRPFLREVFLQRDLSNQVLPSLDLACPLVESFHLTPAWTRFQWDRLMTPSLISHLPLCHGWFQTDAQTQALLSSWCRPLSVCVGLVASGNVTTACSGDRGTCRGCSVCSQGVLNKGVELV